MVDLKLKKRYLYFTKFFLTLALTELGNTINHPSLNRLMAKE